VASGSPPGRGRPERGPGAPCLESHLGNRVKGLKGFGEMPPCLSKGTLGLLDPSKGLMREADPHQIIKDRANLQRLAHLYLVHLAAQAIGIAQPCPKPSVPLPGADLVANVTACSSKGITCVAPPPSIWAFQARHDKIGLERVRRDIQGSFTPELCGRTLRFLFLFHHTMWT
jgi:hypothetical protein